MVEGGQLKCKNAIVCNSFLPAWWYEPDGNYLCRMCILDRGKVLPVHNNGLCLACAKVTTTVEQSKCEHALCVDCFRAIYYAWDMSDEPQFPYSAEVETQYVADRENPKWRLEYPLIQKWSNDLKEWDFNKKERALCLRTCPVCGL